MIVRLGSGKAAGYGCGPKAALLDRASRAGLSVPAGVVVLDEGWRSALDRGLVRIEGTGGRQSVSVPDPTLLVHLLGLPAFDGYLAVRSAFSVEDEATESLAGAFVTGLFVDGRRSSALAAGLAGVWASALGRPRSVRRDVIIQEMVVARRAGVAFSETAYEDDLVNATEGNAADMLAGKVPAQSFVVPRLRAGERPTAAGAEARLQILLRGVRRAFGEGDWDVEWADDGTRVRLLQVRAVTRPTRRDELLTSAGHREVLPDPPSRFTASLIAAQSDRLFDVFREVDPGLPATRPLVEVLHGRPFANLSLLRETLRRWGLPTRFVSQSIGVPAELETGTRLLRLLHSGPALVRLGRLQAGAARAARVLSEEIRSRPAPAASATLGDIVEDLGSVYRDLARGMLSLSAAAIPALAVLRRAGILDVVTARARPAETGLLDGLAELRQLGARAELRPALERGEIPDDPGFRAAFEAWLARHGHRGAYESDLARPRYREDPGPLLRSLAAGLAAPRELPPPSLTERMLLPIVRGAEGILRARAELRSAAMLAYDRARAAMLARARRLALDGALPDEDAIWQLDTGEVARLEDDFRPDTAFWRARTAEIEADQEYEFPVVFRRFDDLEGFRTWSRGPGPERLRGLGLTRGEVRGRAWVLAEPSVELPRGFRPEETVLVARAIDWGWIPTLSRVAGVVVEQGGDLSHGSILLRELGLPAVTGVGGAAQTLRTGDSLVVRADQGSVVRIEEDRE